MKLVRGRLCPAVLCHQYVDTVLAQQRGLVGHGERASRRQHSGVRGHRLLGQLHGPNDEVTVSQMGEGGRARPARGQEHPAAAPRQQVRRRVQGVDQVPAAPGAWQPARAAQHHRRNPGGRRGPRRVDSDRLGERVRGVDQGVHVLLTQPSGQPLGRAEAPDAYVPGKCPGPRHTPRERRGDPDTAARRERGGRFARLGGAAEDQAMGGIATSVRDPGRLTARRGRQDST
jgi:hypothetical protein